MPDYKKMYLTLFHAITDTITLLEDAQRKTEELYVDADEEDSEHKDNFALQ